MSQPKTNPGDTIVCVELARAAKPPAAPVFLARGMEESPKGPPEDLLSSWKEIAVYLDTTVRNAHRWEQEAGLPVRRLLHKRKASVYAYRSEIETWRASRDMPADVAAELSAIADHVEPRVEAGSGSQRVFRTGLVAGAVIAVIALAVAGYRWRASPEHSPRVTLLTSLEGVEISPMFSPDGARVAFCWMQPGRSDYDIYVAGVDGGQLEPLAETEYSEISPAWSRDGTKLAFLRIRGARGDLPMAEIVILTLDGGQEEVVGRPGAPPRPIGWLPESYLTWTTDGTALIMAGGGQRRRGLYRFDLATSNIDRLTNAPEGSLGDFSPNLSPDGRLLTFVRKSAPFLGDVYILDLANSGASARRLTSWGRWTTTPTFTPDGSEILVSSGDVSGERRFWSLDPAGAQEPRLLALSGEDTFGLTLAPGNGRPRMAFTRGVIKSDIWRATLGDNPKTERVIASSRLDSNPALSPDGSRLVFESNRSGRTELWISDANGANQRQLTSNAPPLAGSAEWSPDGTQLITPAILDGRVQVFRVSPENGALTQLTDGAGDKLNARWALDGKTIHFFFSRAGNVGYIAQMPAQGGEIQRILDGTSSIVAIESPAGGFFVATSGGRLLQLRDGRTEPQGTRVGRPAALRATAKGLVFLSPPAMRGTPGFYLQGYDGDRPELLAEVDRPWLGLAVSDDATQLYYSRVEENELDLHFVDEVW